MNTTHITLNGPDGSTLLGFLAALGAFTAVQRVWPSEPLRLHWKGGSGWHPLLDGLPQDVANQPASLASKLYAMLSAPAERQRFVICGQDGELYLNPDKVLTADFRRLARDSACASRMGERLAVDFFSSFGCDVEDGEAATAEATRLCIVGSSQQYFFKSMRELAQEPVVARKDSSGRVRNQGALDEDPATTPEHLHEALFGPWRYRDASPTLKWDAADDRRHALRALDPTDDRAPIRTVRGAYRLAIEALTIFPCVPAVRARHAETTAFTRIGDQQFLSWPVWTKPLSLDAIRSLVVHPELSVEHPRRGALEALAVSEVFRSERLQEERQFSFSVSRPVLR